MTIETRCLIELSDILGIEFQCKHCKGRFLLGSETRRSIPWDCPFCKETWLAPETDEGQALDTFVRILRDLDSKMQGRNFSLKLHITSPESEGTDGS